MVVCERYPDLKANQGFRDLRVQLEGTENRITVARNRYIQAVQEYNVLARSFPTNLTAMVFGYKPKPSFTVQNEAQISTPPQVDFGTKKYSASRDAPACIGAGMRRPAAGAAASAFWLRPRRRRTCCPVPPLIGARDRPDRHARRHPASRAWKTSCWPSSRPRARRSRS